MNAEYTPSIFQKRDSSVRFHLFRDVDFEGFKSRMQVMKEQLEQQCKASVRLIYLGSVEAGDLRCIIL